MRLHHTQSAITSLIRGEQIQRGADRRSIHLAEDCRRLNERLLRNPDLFEVELEAGQPVRFIRLDP